MAKLHELVGQMVPSLKNKPEFTFDQLIAATNIKRKKCLPLKIVASDVTRRHPAIFSRESSDYGKSVLDAVRATTSYPFIFQPVVGAGRRLADGGLSSNLPVFLFDEEYRRTRVPTLAFDLITTDELESKQYQFGDFCRDLLTTALESSDELLRLFLKGIEHVQIQIPSGIRTLDFDLARDKRESLFTAGYEQTGKFLAKYRPLLASRAMGGNASFISTHISETRSSTNRC